MCDIHTEVFITIIEGDPFGKGFGEEPFLRKVLPRLITIKRFMRTAHMTGAFFNHHFLHHKIHYS